MAHEYDPIEFVEVGRVVNIDARPSETMRDIIKRKLNQSLSDQNYQAAEIYVGWLSYLKTLDEK